MPCIPVRSELKLPSQLLGLQCRIWQAQYCGTNAGIVHAWSACSGYSSPESWMQRAISSVQALGACISCQQCRKGSYCVI